jgi:hypothetical protein
MIGRLFEDGHNGKALLMLDVGLVGFRRFA